MVGSEIQWNEEKNEWLKKHRNLSFEQVLAAVESDLIIADLVHPTRSGQRLLLVEIDGYVCSVPYVQDGNVKFLKTVHQNRKFQKEFRLMP
jgi:uncharacterized DUF497 family protein